MRSRNEKIFLMLSCSVKCSIRKMAHILVSYLSFSCFFGKRIMKVVHEPLSIQGLSSSLLISFPW